MGNITNSLYAKNFPDQDCEASMAAIRQALNDEHDAVNTYQALLSKKWVRGLVEDKDVEKYEKTLAHIRDEEMDHEEELMQLIEMLQKQCVPDMGKHHTPIK
jgi:rubrerythrin